MLLYILLLYITIPIVRNEADVLLLLCDASSACSVKCIQQGNMVTQQQCYITQFNYSTYDINHLQNIHNESIHNTFCLQRFNRSAMLSFSFEYGINVLTRPTWYNNQLLASYSYARKIAMSKNQFYIYDYTQNVQQKDLDM